MQDMNDAVRKAIAEATPREIAIFINYVMAGTGSNATTSSAWLQALPIADALRWVAPLLAQNPSLRDATLHNFRTPLFGRHSPHALAEAVHGLACEPDEALRLFRPREHVLNAAAETMTRHGAQAVLDAMMEAGYAPDEYVSRRLAAIAAEARVLAREQAMQSDTEDTRVICFESYRLARN